MYKEDNRKIYVAIRGCQDKDPETHSSSSTELLVESGWEVGYTNRIPFYARNLDGEPAAAVNVPTYKFHMPEDTSEPIKHVERYNDSDRLSGNDRLRTMIKLLIESDTDACEYIAKAMFRSPERRHEATHKVFVNHVRYFSNEPMIIDSELGGDDETYIREYMVVPETLYDGNDEDREGDFNTPMFWRHDVHRCEDCGLAFSENYKDNIGGSWCTHRDTWSCQSCADDNFAYCDTCDDTMHSEFSRYSERLDQVFCNSCWDDRPTPIHSYNYMPDPLNFWDYKSGSYSRVFSSPREKNRINRLYYGFENEVECQDDYNKYDIAQEIGENNKFVYCKEDGSLENGFEIVSHPMTFSAFKNLDFEEMFLDQRGAIRGYAPESTGMHVHMSRNAFTDNHLLKFMSMIYEYKTFTHFIAQRPFTSAYNRWAKFKAGTLERVKHNMAKNIKSKKRGTSSSSAKTFTMLWGEKYSPVNLSKRQTVEVRVFKANLEEVSFRKNVEYCDALYHFTYKTPHYGLKLDSFVDFARRNRKEYRNLNKFFDDRPEGLKEALRFPLSIPEGMEID
jgi:hypothetical protein